MSPVSTLKSNFCVHHHSFSAKQDLPLLLCSFLQTINTDSPFLIESVICYASVSLLNGCLNGSTPPDVTVFTEMKVARWISSVQMFDQSNRSFLKAGNSSWALLSWKKESLVCILIHFIRTSLVLWFVAQIQDLWFDTLCRLIFPFLHWGPMSSHLMGPNPWINPTQYFYCSGCTPVGGMVQPSAIFSGGSPYNQVMHTLSGIIPQAR